MYDILLQYYQPIGVVLWLTVNLANPKAAWLFLKHSPIGWLALSYGVIVLWLPLCAIVLSFLLHVKSYEYSKTPLPTITASIVEGFKQGVERSKLL
jgi:hypothetical protein